MNDIKTARRRLNFLIIFGILWLGVQFGCLFGLHTNVVTTGFSALVTIAMILLAGYGRWVLR